MPGKTKTMKDHIIDQIEKTGYPLEIEVSEQLDKDWIVFNNQPYLDEDENKTREIDIFALHETDIDQLHTKPEPLIFIATDMVAECKKSATHAWVFFTRPKGTPPGFGEDQTIDFVEVHSQRKKRLLDIVNLPDLHYDRFQRIAHTYTEIKLQGESSKRKEASEKEIFEASNQLMKYAAYDMQRAAESMASDSSKRGIQLMFLAIVFDGRLYEAMTTKGTIRLEERWHMLLSATRYSKSKGGMSRYIIDVVAKTYFPEYLKHVENDIRVLRSFFESKKDQLLSKADAEMKDLMPGVYVSKRAP